VTSYKINHRFQSVVTIVRISSVRPPANKKTNVLIRNLCNHLCLTLQPSQ